MKAIITQKENETMIWLQKSKSMITVSKESIDLTNNQIAELKKLGYTVDTIESVKPIPQNKQVPNTELIPNS